MRCIPNTTLRTLRQATRLTQAELAVRAGLSQQQVARLETGQRVGRLPTWRRLAAVLSVSIDTLTGAKGKG